MSPDAFERHLTEGMAREAASAGTGFRFTNGCAHAARANLVTSAPANRRS